MTRKERKKRPVWEHFNLIDNNDNNPHPRVQCKYCPKEFKRAVREQMQAHLDKKCPNAPNNAKSQFDQQSNSTSILMDYMNEEIVRKMGPAWENFHTMAEQNCLENFKVNLLNNQ